MRTGDDGWDSESRPIYAENGCVMNDSTVLEVDCVQSSNDNSLDSTINVDSNCYSKKKSYDNSNAKKNLNESLWL